MSYAVTVNLTEAARRVFQGMDIPSSPVTSLASFRTICQKMNQSCIASRKRMEEERGEMLKVYSQGIVAEKLEELNGQYNNRLASVQNSLREKLNAILAAKENAIADYTTVPASDEQMRLLQTVQLRGKDVSDTEWSMIVRKCADNYQALSVVKTLAEKLDKPFSMPFSPDADLEKVKAIRGRFEQVIDAIDKEASTYATIELLNYGQDQASVTTSLINDLDTSLSSATPLSYLDRLREASRHALHNSQYDLSSAITNFLVEHMDDLKGTIPSTEVRIAADELIKAGLNAQEPKVTFETHRNKVIEKLEDAVGKSNDAE